MFPCSIPHSTMQETVGIVSADNYSMTPSIEFSEYVRASIFPITGVYRASTPASTFSLHKGPAVFEPVKCGQVEAIRLPLE